MQLALETPRFDSRSPFAPRLHILGVNSASHLPSSGLATPRQLRIAEIPFTYACAIPGAAFDKVPRRIRRYAALLQGYQLGIVKPRSFARFLLIVILNPRPPMEMHCVTKHEQTTASIHQTAAEIWANALSRVDGQNSDYRSNDIGRHEAGIRAGQCPVGRNYS